MFQWGQGALEVKAPPAPPPSTPQSQDATLAPTASDAAAPSGGADSEAEDPSQVQAQAPAPAPSPGRADGWQLLGFTQHHPHTAQPVLLHRTMNKWTALRLARRQQPQPHQPEQEEQGQRAADSAARADLSLAATERNWPVQLVTGPLPTR